MSLLLCMEIKLDTLLGYSPLLYPAHLQGICKYASPEG